MANDLQNTSPAQISVQICFATPARQILRDIKVPVGTTLHRAISQSGVLQEAPEIDLSTCRVGIYNRLKTLDTVLNAHDRIEIYRPLIADPKQARHARAKKDNSKKAEKND